MLDGVWAIISIAIVWLYIRIGEMRDDDGSEGDDDAESESSDDRLRGMRSCDPAD